MLWNNYAGIIMLEYDRWNAILLIVLYGYDTISMKKNR